MECGIVLHEVGLRDGLQMEQQVVPTERKIDWIGRLLDAGIGMIQVGSFVHPGKVPQMADSDILLKELRARGMLRTGVTFSALVLNERGLARGLAAGAGMLCMGVSASETHSRKNTGMTIAEATGRIIAIAGAAGAAGLRVQLSVQSAFGCGYEGAVPRARVLSIAREFFDAGFRTLSLADTAGHATPDSVERMFEGLREMSARSGATPGNGGEAAFACHFHNTYGLALANCYAAWKAGVKYFETSIAGLGGCPFTKVAGGNACTEDLVHMLQRMGLMTNVGLEGLIALAGDVAAFFGRDLPGAVYRTGAVPEAG